MHANGGSPDLSLIVTSQARWSELDQFFLHLVQAVDHAPEINVQLILVAQAFEVQETRLPRHSRLTVTVVSAPKTSLSNARNIGLAHVTGSIVGFPDDDCWYPQQTLQKVARAFANEPDCRAICTRVADPVANKAYGHRPVARVRIDYKNALTLPISVGIFCRADGITPVVFDERLGAGCRLGAGEETDLIMRLLVAQELVIYDGTIDVYHLRPTYTTTAAKKERVYALGFGAVVRRYLRSGGLALGLAFATIVVRTFAGMIVNLLAPGRRNTYAGRLAGLLSGVSLPAAARAPSYPQR